MMQFLRSAYQWICGTRLFRRLGGALFRNRARRRTAELDTLSVARCQQRILRGLVHQAHATPFGRAHDFRRIRTPADFQRLVPLRTPASLWSDYWQPVFPDLADITWPGPVSGLAVAARPAENGPLCLPISPSLLAAHHAALQTSLALAGEGRRDSNFLAGQFCYVSEDDRTNPGAETTPAATWDSLLGRDLSATFQPPLRTLSPEADPPPGQSGEVSALIGPARNLTVLFDKVQQRTGRPRLGDIWPRLGLVLSTSGPFTLDTGRVATAAGNDGVQILEAFLPPEGPVAVHDPRHGLLRLLPDHEVYFEFVPLEDLEKPRPVRHGAAEVEPGVTYALALTSPAGIWACLTGTRVCFESRDPPLLRGLEPGREAQRWWAGEEEDSGPSAQRTASAAHQLQPPHPWNGALAGSPGPGSSISGRDRGGQPC
jgi:hypothetical protein